MTNKPNPKAWGFTVVDKGDSVFVCFMPHGGGCRDDGAEFETEAVYYFREEYNGMPNVLLMLDDFGLWPQIEQEVITLAQQKYD